MWEGLQLEDMPQEIQENSHWINIINVLTVGKSSLTKYPFCHQKFHMGEKLYECIDCGVKVC